MPDLHVVTLCTGTQWSTPLYGRHDPAGCGIWSAVIVGNSLVVCTYLRFQDWYNPGASVYAYKFQTFVQAWSLADPLQGPNDVYESDWLSEVRKLGPEKYYPPVRL